MTTTPASPALPQHWPTSLAGLSGLARLIACYALIISLLAVLGGCAKPTEEEYLNRAKAALTEDDLDTAVINLKNALSLNKANGEARWLLGTTYLAQEDGASAEKELRRAKELGVSEQSLLLPLAQAYYIQRKFKNVIKLKPSKTITSADIRAQLLVLQGRSQLALADPVAAQDVFGRAWKIAPQHIEVMTGMAALKASQENYDEARQLLSSVQASDPTYAPAWRQLAELEQQQGNFEAALAAHTQTIALEPNNSPDLVQRALVYIQLARLDDAKNDLAQARKSGKQFPLMDFAEGVIAVLEDRNEAAKKSLQIVLNNIPDYLPATFYLGLASYKNGEIEQARELLTRYYKQNPDSASVNRLLGGIYLTLGDTDTAKAHLLRAVRINPDDVESIKMLGQLALTKGAPTEAIEYFRQVIAKEAGKAENYFNLGYSYSVARQADAARHAYLQATELDPELFAAEVGIIGDYVNNGEFDLALDYTHQLQKKWPDKTDPLSLESAVHLALGDRQSARDVLERALKLVPGDPSSSHNLASLALQESDFNRAQQLYQGALEHNPRDVTTIMRLAKVQLVSGNEADAVALVKKALDIEPESLEVSATLATYYLKQDQLEQARAVIAGVAEKHADEPGLLEIQAKIALASGQHQNAKELLSQLIKQQPRSAEAYFLLAKANAKLATGDTVIANLQRTLTLDPEHFEAKLALARIYSTNAAFEQSDAILDSLADVYSAHPQVLYLTGLKALREGKAAAAYKLFIEAQKTEPQGEYAVSMSVAQFHMQKVDEGLATLKSWLKDHPDDMAVQYHLANSLLLLNRNDDAKTELRRALRIQPNHTAALNNLAWLIREESPSEAENLVNKALDLAPDLPQALHTLAVIKLNAKQPQQALDLLTRAAAVNKDDPMVQFRLGVTLQRLDRKTEADELFKRLLASKTLPDNIRQEIQAGQIK